MISLKQLQTWAIYVGFFAAPSLSHAQEVLCKPLLITSDDALTASPANHTLLFENADIRVLDVHSQPHTRETVHTHALPSVMYIERQGAGTYDTPDGSDHRSHPTDPNFKPRVIAIKSEGPHWTENTGDIPFHAIRVEFKHPGCGPPGWTAATPAKDDALVAAPANHTLLFENTEVRVIDIHVPAHTASTMHSHAGTGVYYVIQPARTRSYTLGSTQPELRAFPPAVKILPAQPETHKVENIDSTDLHLIRFELKHAAPTSF